MPVGCLVNSSLHDRPVKSVLSSSPQSDQALAVIQTLGGAVVGRLPLSAAHPARSPLCCITMHQAGLTDRRRCGWQLCSVNMTVATVTSCGRRATWPDRSTIAAARVMLTARRPQAGAELGRQVSFVPRCRRRRPTPRGLRNAAARRRVDDLERPNLRRGDGSRNVSASGRVASEIAVA